MLIAGALVFNHAVTIENVPEALAVITLVPDAVLFLPRLLGYKG
jgi:hypothetical protein